MTNTHVAAQLLTRVIVIKEGDSVSNSLAESNPGTRVYLPELLPRNSWAHRRLRWPTAFLSCAWNAPQSGGHDAPGYPCGPQAYGDCSQVRMANLYANVCQVAKARDMRECFNMITRRPADIMRLANYGLAVGKSADLVVLDCKSPEMAIAALAPVLYAFKHGRKTVSQQQATLHRPDD